MKAQAFFPAIGANVCNTYKIKNLEGKVRFPGLRITWMLAVIAEGLGLLRKVKMTMGTTCDS